MLVWCCWHINWIFCICITFRNIISASLMQIRSPVLLACGESVVGESVSARIGLLRKYSHRFVHRYCAGVSPFTWNASIQFHTEWQWFLWNRIRLRNQSTGRLDDPVVRVRVHVFLISLRTIRYCCVNSISLRITRRWWRLLWQWSWQSNGGAN